MGVFNEIDELPPEEAAGTVRDAIRRCRGFVDAAADQVGTPGIDLNTYRSEGFRQASGDLDRLTGSITVKAMAPAQAVILRTTGTAPLLTQPESPRITRRAASQRVEAAEAVGPRSPAHETTALQPSISAKSASGSNAVLARCRGVRHRCEQAGSLRGCRVAPDRRDLPTALGEADRGGARGHHPFSACAAGGPCALHGARPDPHRGPPTPTTRRRGVPAPRSPHGRRASLLRVAPNPLVQLVRTQSGKNRREAHSVPISRRSRPLVVAPAGQAEWRLYWKPFTARYVPSH